MKDCFSKLTVAALTVVGTMWVSSAYAGQISPLFADADNKVKFENFENEINVSGGTPGVADVGDRLRGVLHATTVKNLNTLANAPLEPAIELTGIFDVEIVKIETVGSDQVITFGVSGAFDTGGDLDSIGGVDIAANTMIALFQDTTPDFASTFADGTKTLSEVETAATNGKHLGSFGLGTGLSAPGDVGAAGNGYWFSVNATPLFPSETDFLYGLTLLDDDPDSPLFKLTDTPLLNPELPGGASVPAGSHVLDNVKIFGTTFLDLVGKGQTSANAGLGSQRSDLYDIKSDDPAYTHPNPEPSSVVLFALGALCGIPYLRRRRKNRVA